MRVRAYRDFERESVVITVQTGENGKYITIQDGVERIEEVEPNGIVPPYLRIRSDVAAALGIVPEGERRDSPPTARHLDDAIAVRDRLLTLVEGVVENA